jgi:protein-S-isoprenylcysteine O-methyltransferase Ste14
VAGGAGVGVVDLATHACMHAFIAREEQFLTEQFGESYLQYKRQVRRWV